MCSHRLNHFHNGHAVAQLLHASENRLTQVIIACPTSRAAKPRLCMQQTNTGLFTRLLTGCFGLADDLVLPLSAAVARDDFVLMSATREGKGLLLIQALLLVICSANR